MSLVLVGIDEAGYGPMLGPMCMSASAFLIEGWKPGDTAPDLWAMLAPLVVRTPGQVRAARTPALAVNDSKALKLPNGSKVRHPCTLLERGVLSFLRVSSGAVPGSDLEYFGSVAASRPRQPWYAGPATPWPIGHTRDELLTLSSALGAGHAHAGVRFLGFSCRCVCESGFNDAHARLGNKSGVWEEQFCALMEDVRRTLIPPGDVPVRIVCDHQGARTRYTGLLERAMPGDPFVTLQETPTQSRYASSCRDTRVVFRTEAEREHLPVALASMCAKLTREACMARFNRHWCGLHAELKPTAGYTRDARRWIADLLEHDPGAPVSQMVRRA